MTQVKKEVKQKQNLKHLRDKMREKVTGIFRFYEVPGGGIGFNFKEFKEDQVERYDMIDGETYTIPLGVARHLNRSGWYPLYGYIKGEDGVHSGISANNTQMTIVRKIRRYSFQSLEFVDIDDMPNADNPIIEVHSSPA